MEDNLVGFKADDAFETGWVAVFHVDVSNGVIATKLTRRNYVVKSVVEQYFLCG